MADEKYLDLGAFDALSPEEQEAAYAAAVASGYAPEPFVPGPIGEIPSGFQPSPRNLPDYSMPAPPPMPIGMPMPIMPRGMPMRPMMPPPSPLPAYGGGMAPIQFPTNTAPFVQFLNWVLFDPNNRANPKAYMRWDSPASNVVLMVDEKQNDIIGVDIPAGMRVGGNGPDADNIRPAGLRPGTMRGDAAGFGIKIGSSGKPNANISWQREMNRFGFEFQGKKTIGDIVYRTFVHSGLSQNDPRTIAHVTDTRQIQQFRPDRGISPRSTSVRQGRRREPYGGDAKLGIPAAWQPNPALQSEQSVEQIRRLAVFAQAGDLQQIISDLNVMASLRGGGNGGVMMASGAVAPVYPPMPLGGPVPIMYPPMPRGGLPPGIRPPGIGPRGPMMPPGLMGPPSGSGLPPALRFPAGVEQDIKLVPSPTPRRGPMPYQQPPLSPLVFDPNAPINLNASFSPLGSVSPYVMPLRMSPANRSPIPVYMMPPPPLPRASPRASPRPVPSPPAAFSPYGSIEY